MIVCRFFVVLSCVFFFFKQKTAYEMRISDWSSDVCSSDLLDVMDGRVARMTGTQTEFGVQYDSLSDLVSFGLAPALVMYTWSLSALRDMGPLWGKQIGRASCRERVCQYV